MGNEDTKAPEVKCFWEGKDQRDKPESVCFRTDIIEVSKLRGE